MILTASKGVKRNRTYLKAGIRGVLFFLLLAVYAVYQTSIHTGNEVTTLPTTATTTTTAAEALATADKTDHQLSRQLLENLDETTTLCDEAREDLRKADPAWFAVFYFLGVLYMFVAIAIVCDELFVPTLEEISSDRHMNLSMDVAGATLMAAGGSAPELFTSIFGTFVQESEVGIGTVVGSAVFNVMFVIAMCALCAKEVLELTWWPLFRDSAYYSLGLVVLGLFVGVISPSEIELWEALVLFGMYIGYVIMMAFNRRIYKNITGKELKLPEETIVEDEEEVGHSAAETSAETHERANSSSSNNNNSHHGNDDEDDEESPKDDTTSTAAVIQRPAPQKSLSARSLVSAVSSSRGKDPSPSWPGTFRSGVLKLLRDPESWADTAGVGIVAVIAGDVQHVFREVDVDGNGEIDKDELQQLFAKLDCDTTVVSSEELDKVMDELDSNNDGKITEEDFTAWYIKSEKRISSRVGTVFKLFDVDNSGTINRSKIRNLLETLEPNVTDEDVEEAMNAMYQSGSRDEITFEEFSDWYIHSVVYQRQTQKVEEDMMGILDSLKPPEKGSGFLAYAQYIIILPIVAALGFTVPDVRRPGCHKFCYLSFVLSILWIGVFSYFMVDWAEIIGHTIGIPSVIMGLTLLAAGTSVPDLLTSVIVARMGEGDMALSSSIGSNIFDILVGLPLPWICYTAWNQSVITIGSKNVWVYIFTLLGMLVFVVVTTHCQGWKLTRTLAGLMLIFYFGFLALAISLELPFETC